MFTVDLKFDGTPEIPDVLGHVANCSNCRMTIAVRQRWNNGAMTMTEDLYNWGALSR